MTTREEIKTLLYRLVSSSALAAEVSGVVSKRGRPKASTAEDITVSVASSDCSVLQKAIGYVNVYVPFNPHNWEEDGPRILDLERLSARVLTELNGIHGGVDYLIRLTEQGREEPQGARVSVITNRLDIRLADNGSK